MEASTDTNANVDHDTKNNEEETQLVYKWISGILEEKFHPENQVELVSFELDAEDAECVSEGIVVPLKIDYWLNQKEKIGENLVVHLPQYFVNTPEELEGAQGPVHVQTQETYFFSKVVPDLQEFLKSWDLDCYLPVPNCFYVKHDSDFKHQVVASEIQNLPQAKTLLVLEDLRKEGFAEMEPFDGSNLKIAEDVAVEIAKLHAVSYCFGMFRKESLKTLWPQVPLILDAPGVTKRLIEASLEYFETECDDESLEELYIELLFKKEIIESILNRKTCEKAMPESIIHLMIGGPNLYIKSLEIHSDEDSLKAFKCAITNWRLVTIGNPILDFALFTCVSLLPKLSGIEIHEIMVKYWDAFNQTCQDLKTPIDIEFNDFTQEFKRQQIWGILFMIAACKVSGDLDSEETKHILEYLLKLIKDMETKMLVN